MGYRYLLAIGFVLGLSLPLAHAETINVTTTDDSLADDGYCSLREAIRNANSDTQVDNDDCSAGTGNDDVVSIPSGTYTLSLGEGDDENTNPTNSAAGDLDIGYDPVTLSGESASTTIIDASGIAVNSLGDRDRVMDVRADTVLQDLTLTGGRVPYGGGAIRTNSSDTSLTLTRCIVTENTVTGTKSSAEGGGISIYGDSLTLTDTTVSNNTVEAPAISGSYFSGGGGIHIRSIRTSGNPSATVSVIITGSTISGNSLTTTDRSGYGAGLSAESYVSLNVSSSVIRDNVLNGTPAYGGGIYLINDTLTMDGSTVISNSVSSASNYAKGAGIYADDSRVTLTQSTISLNSGVVTASGYPVYGGGLHVEGNSTLSLNKVSVISNTSSAGSDLYGAGINLYVDGSDVMDVTIYNSTVASNTVTASRGPSAGAGIAARASSTTTSLEMIVANSTIANNTVSVPGYASAKGGGLYAVNATGSFYNVTVSGNAGTQGGGLYSSGSTLSTYNSIWAHNTATSGGTDCYGTFTVGKYNVIEDSTDCTISSLEHTLSIDPLLEILQNNGGDTETMQIVTGSPAIDGGDPEGCTISGGGTVITVDQRNYERTVDGDSDGVAVCDIGAYEVGAVASTSTLSLTAESDCIDGSDNDSDGLADCSDTDCSTDSYCDDSDGDGFSVYAGDCDESNATRYPGASESANGGDDDCDDVADEGTTMYDDDGDGYCEADDCSYTFLSGDCDDTNSAISPVATEDPSSAADDDCDGTTNDPDVDDDEDGVTEDGGDCDDTDDQINPSSTEIANGEDDDCDGTTDEGTSVRDDDGDGYCEAACTDGNDPGDCDDALSSIFPNATEIITDSVDNDCDGTVDEADASEESGSGSRGSSGSDSGAGATSGTGSSTSDAGDDGSGDTGSGAETADEEPADPVDETDGNKAAKAGGCSLSI